MLTEGAQVDTYQTLDIYKIVRKQPLLVNTKGMGCITTKGGAPSVPNSPLSQPALPYRSRSRLVGSQEDAALPRRSALESC